MSRINKKKKISYNSLHPQIELVSGEQKYYIYDEVKNYVIDFRPS